MADDASALERARQLIATGQWDAASGACREVLASDPRNARAHDLQGVIAQARQQFAEALRSFDQAAKMAPADAGVQLHRGIALRALGRGNEALVAFRRAAALDPKSATAHHELGNALKRQGRLADAVTSLREASRLAPDEATVWLNLGAALLELGRPRDAVPCFRRGVELEPGRIEARNILGAALADEGSLTEAETVFRAILAERPEYAAAHNNLARVLKGQGRMPEAVAEYRAALAVQPDPGTHSNLVYALNFVPDLTPESIWGEHRKWAETYAEPLTRAATAIRRDLAAKRLRVGFVSPDLVNHAVAYFFEPLLAARDRNVLEIFCYSDALVPDRVTERLRRLADHWRDTGAWSHEQLDAAIRRDGIDVLVDLAGHTARNRLLVFARKPAPVQATWLGYPNTTGLSAIDYRITDSAADPDGVTDKTHSESLIRLPKTFLCYQPPAESPEVSELPCRNGAPVTFASFSNYAKISDPCVETWAAILTRVPGARLILKSRGLADPAIAAAAKRRFETCGVPGDRLVLDGTLVGTAEHLALYHHVDVALDPFPYNGTTTTCEALWMGVPVITLAGATHVARVGVSLMTAIGHAEWIAQTRDDYVRRAVALATSAERLAQVRANLRAEVARSALGDASGFARDMEAALRRMGGLTTSG